MSLSQQQQQQFNSLSHKVYNPAIHNNEGSNSQERLNLISNGSLSKQQLLLYTPGGQNTQKGVPLQSNQQQQQQIGLQSPSGYQNLTSFTPSVNSVANNKYQKNLNTIAFNNITSNQHDEQQQSIIHHQNSGSNHSESLTQELRNFFQESHGGTHPQSTIGNDMSTNNTKAFNSNITNKTYTCASQNSKNGTYQSNQLRMAVMTPSTNADDKSILSANNNFPSGNQKQVDLSISSQSHNQQQLMLSQLHSKNVSQTTQMSAFNTSGEISQFNYSSLGNTQNIPVHQYGSGNISQVITNINLDSDNLSQTTTLPQNLSISTSTINNNNTSQCGTLRCRFHPNKKVKYQMNQNENEKFCTICALEYAKQGFDVEAILKIQQKEINQYLNEMHGVKGLNDMLMTCLDNKQEFIKEHCRQQSQFMHELFLQIEKAIYEHKTQLLSQINHKMWESINEIELKKNETRLFEQKLLLKQQDIERNYNQVTTQMGISEVREILFFYNQELDQIRSNINDIFKNTTFELVSLNQNQLQQQIQILKSFISEDILKPSILYSPLQESLNTSTIQRNSPSKNDKNQLSRFMSNQEKRGSGKKQQQMSLQQQQNKSLAQQLQNYQMEQLQQQPSSQQVLEINNQMTKQNQQQKSQVQIKQNNQFSNEMIIMNNINHNIQKEQQIYAASIQQKQNQNLQQYNEIIDTSISEKQHTQESDDLSSVQGVYQNIQNQSKISNKSNISSHKIINYSDIHDEPNLNLIKEQSSPTVTTIPVKKVTPVRDSRATPTPVPQEKKSPFTFQCVSPQQNSKGENIYRQQFSTNKQDSQFGQKQRQTIQTEPTHLPSNKVKQGVSKQGNYQRNLMMNDEIATSSNNKFKLNQTPNNNFSLITHFNKQNNNTGSSNLIMISPNNNKSSEQAIQNNIPQSKCAPTSSIRQLQFNLADQDGNSKSLTSRAINGTNNQGTVSYVNSLQQNQSTNIVAQLIQQKQQQLFQQQQNTLKNTNNFQQHSMNEFNHSQQIKN